MQLSQKEAINKYDIGGFWFRISDFEHCDLYSGTENDPEVIAITSADCLLRDVNGIEMPYDINISIFGIPLEEGESMYEMTHKELMRRQKICTQIILFRSIGGYSKYKEDNATIILNAQNTSNPKTNEGNLIKGYGLITSK